MELFSFKTKDGHVIKVGAVGAESSYEPTITHIHTRGWFRAEGTITEVTEWTTRPRRIFSTPELAAQFARPSAREIARGAFPFGWDKSPAASPK